MLYYSSHTRFPHVWLRLLYAAAVAYQQKFLHRSPVGRLLRVRCWLGSCWDKVRLHTTKLARKSNNLVWGSWSDQFSPFQGGVPMKYILKFIVLLILFKTLSSRRRSLNRVCPCFELQCSPCSVVCQYELWDRKAAAHGMDDAKGLVQILGKFGWVCRKCPLSIFSLLLLLPPPLPLLPPPLTHVSPEVFERLPFLSMFLSVFPAASAIARSLPPVPLPGKLWGSSPDRQPTSTFPSNGREGQVVFFCKKKCCVCVCGHLEGRRKWLMTTTRRRRTRVRFSFSSLSLPFFTFQATRLSLWATTTARPPSSAPIHPPTSSSSSSWSWASSCCRTIGQQQQKEEEGGGGGDDFPEGRKKKFVSFSTSVRHISRRDNPKKGGKSAIFYPPPPTLHPPQLECCRTDYKGPKKKVGGR